MPFHRTYTVPISLAVSLLLTSVGNAAVLSKTKTAKVVCIGDSITEGKSVGHGGYRQILQDLLKNAGYSITYVGKEDNGDPANTTGFAVGMANPNHEGYGSMRIDQLLNGGVAEGHKSLPIAETITNDDPDICLIMLGTNDVIQSHELGGMLGRLDALVGAIFAAKKGITVVLASITPMNGPRDLVASAYNSGIPLIVAKYKGLGDNIEFADQHSALVAATDTSDGIHPTLRGFQEMAGTWFNVLTGLPAPTLPPLPVVPAPAAVQSNGPVVPAPVGKQGALSFTNALRDGAGGPFSFGFKFTTGPNGATVTALGYLNDGATGDSATHSVGVFDDTTKQLITPATTVVTSGGNLDGSTATFTYVKLATPVKLNPNATYDLAATMVHTGFLKAATGFVTVSSIVASSVKSAYAAGTTLVFPDHTYGANDPANFGPNLLTDDTH